MTNDNIVRYITGVEARMFRNCPTCGTLRLMWQGVTEGGELLTCCASCQQVLRREPIVPTTPAPPLALMRKTGVIGADTPQQVALAVAQWLRSNDPECIGQIEAMTTLTTPKEKVSIVGAPQMPLHLVILVLRMASSTPLEGASDGHETYDPTRSEDQRTRPPGSGSVVPPAPRGVPRPGDDGGPTEDPSRQSER